MDFGEKLQELRKQRGLTQEELAERLYVSRTAVSKWESGRGYPNIDSLKAIAQMFSVTVDALLSSDQLLTLAEADSKQKEMRLRDRTFGLLDVSVAALPFLPFFGQTVDGVIHAVSLLSLTAVSPYLRTAYAAFVIAVVAVGVLTLALQGCTHPLWTRSKSALSLLLGAGGVLLFVISQQPYAAIFLFLFLIIKAVVRLKTP
jgi:transcriptional regulator with XRE-family HTH domain